MNRRHFLTQSLSVLGLGLIGASVAKGQQPPPILMPEQLAEALRQRGHRVTQRDTEDGCRVLDIVVEKDGWRFEVECEYRPGLRTCAMICPLVQVSPTAVRDKLLELFKVNYEMGPAQFSYRETDRRILLETPRYGTSRNVETFIQVLDDLITVVRRTHPTWSRLNG